MTEMEEKVAQCRLCLKQSSFYYSLFNEDIADIIESFTPIKIDVNDNLPSMCCSQCLGDIYLVYKVRCRIIESDKILRETVTELESIEIKTETPTDDVETDKTEEIVIAVKEESGQKEETDTFEQRFETDTSTWSCYCGSFYKTKKAYLKHLETHGQSFRVCNICGAQITSSNFHKHMVIHKGSPQICELCGAVAKNAESLRGHMFYMHKSTAEQYKCTHCGKFYRYKYKYELHVRKNHGGVRTHICEVCGKAFFTLRDVNRHIQMTHMKLRPYICDYCNKGFSSPYAKRTHVRQHTNEKPFKCEVCAEGFRQRVSLKTHLKSKHGITQITEKSLLTVAKTQSGSGVDGEAVANTALT